MAASVPLASRDVEVDAIIARPLFSPIRRPPAPPPPPPVAEAVAAEEPVPILAGFVTRQGRKLAIFRDEEGRSRFVAVGEAVDGWQLVAIGPHHAVLEGQGTGPRIVERPLASRQFSVLKNGGGPVAGLPGAAPSPTSVAAPDQQQPASPSGEPTTR